MSSEKPTLAGSFFLVLLIIMVGPCSFSTGRYLGSVEEKDFWKNKIRTGKTQDLIQVVDAEDKYLKALRELQETNTKSGISTIESY